MNCDLCWIERDFMSKNVWFIRHAQSTGNAGQVTNSPSDIPLTDLGKRQAQLLGEGCDIQPDLVVTSSYIRTVETAKDFLLRFPQVDQQQWPLHEFTYLSPERYQGTTMHERKPIAEKYWQDCDPEFVEGPGAESFDEFVARIEECFAKIDAATKSNIIIFTHGLVMRLILLLQLTQQYRSSFSLMQKYRDMRKFPVANTCILKMRWETKEMSGLSVKHIPQDLITF